MEKFTFKMKKFVKTEELYLQIFYKNVINSMVL